MFTKIYYLFLQNLLLFFPKIITYSYKIYYLFFKEFLPILTKSSYFFLQPAISTDHIGTLIIN